MAGKAKDKEETLTLDNLESALSKDNKVKLAGLDVDGMPPPSSSESFC